MESTCGAGNFVLSFYQGCYYSSLSLGNTKAPIRICDVFNKSFNQWIHGICYVQVMTPTFFPFIVNKSLFSSKISFISIKNAKQLQTKNKDSQNYKSKYIHEALRGLDRRPFSKYRQNSIFQKSVLSTLLALSFALVFRLVPTTGDKSFESFPPLSTFQEGLGNALKYFACLLHN